MSSTQVTTTTSSNHNISSVEFRRYFGKHIKVVEKGERLTLNRKGKAIAVVIPLDDYEFLQEADEKRKQQEVREKLLDDTALALKNLRGMIKDNVTDTSEKIDEILYGRELDD